MTTNMIPTQVRSEKNRKGFTLTEVAIVLGIMGLILGAIWTAAAAVYNNQRISHANTAILQIAQGIRTLYSGTATIDQSTCATVTDLTCNLITAGVIPTDLQNNTTAINPWANGTTRVLIPGAGSASFTIEMTNVPRAACVSILTQVGGESRDRGLLAVATTTADGPVTLATEGTALNVGVPVAVAVTPANGTAACTGNTNTVQFQFSLK